MMESPTTSDCTVPVRLPLRRKIAYSAIVICSFLLLLELLAALFVHPGDTGVRREHENLIRMLGIPTLTEIFEPDTRLFWKLKPDVTNLCVSGTIGDYPVDFTLSTNEIGLRSPPLRGGDSFRVLAVGNSCTFGIGVNDDETWPAVLRERMALFQGEETEVINAGVPGYTAFQGLCYLHEHGLALKPDLVIVCFGFNDAAVWGSRSDRETSRALVSSERRAPLMKSRLIAAMRDVLSRTSGAAHSGDPDGETHPRLSPTDFYNTLVEIRLLCDRSGTPVIFLVWPYRKQKEENLVDLIVYQPGIVAAARATKTPVISLVDAFVRTNKNLYIDNIHANAAGCRTAAEVIAERLQMAQIRKRPGSP